MVNSSDARFLRYPTQNIPTCWYILALPPTPVPYANPKICVTPDANPRRQSVEYRWRWAFCNGAGVGHVHFMLFMSISFASGTQRKPVFLWNMGFSLTGGLRYPHQSRTASRPLHSRTHHPINISRTESVFMIYGIGYIFLMVYYVSFLIL